MSNRFRLPPPRLPAKTSDEMHDLAKRTKLTVADLCKGHPADANTVLAMAFVMHCRELGFDYAHVHHTIDTLMLDEQKVPS